MFKCPFEIYSSPLPWEEYGIILEIPNYCTEEELRMVSEIAEKKTPQLTSDIYPNLCQDLRGGSVCSKSQWIFDNRHAIYDFMVDNLPSAEYRFDAVHEGYDIPRESRPSFLRERVQGNPAGMMDYPPHGDNGKCLTILVPLSPVESVPTRFHGIGWPPNWDVDGNELEPTVPVRSIPWKVNHAYLFCCSSPYSIHSYSGDAKEPRWVINTNIFDNKDIPQETWDVFAGKGEGKQSLGYWGRSDTT